MLPDLRGDEGQFSARKTASGILTTQVIRYETTDF
jgi:hypothetical protein